MHSFSAAMTLIVALSAATACDASGRDDAGPTAIDGGGHGDDPGDGGALDADASPPGNPERRLVHWQQNVEMPAGMSVVARAVEAAFEKYPQPPDVLALEECSAICVCGTGNRPEEDGRCDRVGNPSVISAIRGVTDEEYLARQFGSRAILYRAARFEQVGHDFEFGAALEPFDDFVACAGMDRPQIDQLGVFLRDTRMTAERSDDRHIVVAATQWFSSHCPLSQLARFESWKTHPAFGGDAGARADVFLLSGDFNMHAGVSAYDETPKADWWLRYSAEGAADPDDVGDGKIDLVNQFHGGAIGKEWTFPNPNGYSRCFSSTGPVNCRVDYVWGRVYGDTPVHFVSASTDNGLDVDGERYGDHRGVRTVVSYE